MGSKHLLKKTLKFAGVVVFNIVCAAILMELFLRASQGFFL